MLDLFPSISNLSKNAIFAMDVADKEKNVQVEDAGSNRDAGAGDHYDGTEDDGMSWQAFLAIVVCCFSLRNCTRLLIKSI